MVIPARMRCGFVYVACLTASRIAEAEIGNLGSARRNTSISLGQTGLGSRHRNAVDRGRVVDEILDGSAGRIRPVVCDTGISVQQIIGRTGGISNCIRPFNQVPRKRERSAVGIDTSEDMLAIARRKPDGANIKWIRTNVLSNRLAKNSFDAIWSISTLHYFKGDRQKLLFREIYNLLKPGGVMVADTEFAEQHSSLWVVEFFPSLIERFKDSIYERDQYRAWLEEIGFTSVQFDHLDLMDTEDAALRVGQHEPGQYLESKVRAGIPAFREMGHGELQRGLRKLQMAIYNGSIKEIVKRYESRATMLGDVGLIIAAR
jgi:SAM-dependent methyltransferase